MKARIKSTGDIMPIAPYAKVTLDVCDDRGTPYEVDFENIELLNEDNVGSDVDWSAFRREAAKDILCAMVSGGYGRGRESEHAYLAIKYADELIKHLKQE